MNSKFSCMICVLQSRKQRFFMYFTKTFVIKLNRVFFKNEDKDILGMKYIRLLAKCCWVKGRQLHFVNERKWHKLAVACNEHKIINIENIEFLVDFYWLQRMFITS